MLDGAIAINLRKQIISRGFFSAPTLRPSLEGNQLPDSLVRRPTWIGRNQRGFSPYIIAFAFLIQLGINDVVPWLFKRKRGEKLAQMDRDRLGPKAEAERGL